MINFPAERLRYRDSGGDYIVVGQQPSGNDPDNPLATKNPIWSGARLARMGQMTGEDFESYFKRVNINYLGDEPFKVNEFTRANARNIWQTFREDDRVILLGSAVSKCFRGLTPEAIWSQPFAKGETANGMKVAVIPHPSGVNRWYNDPSNILLVAEFLRECRSGRW